MDPRPYFIFGDIVSAVAVAVLAAVFCHWLFEPGDGMFLTMVLGMVVGMVAGMVLAMGFLMRLFGAMEVMVPAMTIGMVAGMVVAMSRSMTGLALLDHCLLGAVSGLLTLVVIWLANQRLRGEQPLREGGM